MPNFTSGSMVSSWICWAPCDAKSEHNKQTVSSLWGSLSGCHLKAPETLPFLVAQRSPALPCLHEEASPFPCLGACLYFQPSLLWPYRNYSLEVNIFCACPFCVSSLACFPFTLACSFQPLSWRLLPWTTLAASAVGVLPSGLGSAFSLCCQGSPCSCMCYLGQHCRINKPDPFHFSGFLWVFLEQSSVERDQG